MQTAKCSSRDRFRHRFSPPKVLPEEWCADRKTLPWRQDPAERNRLWRSQTGRARGRVRPFIIYAADLNRQITRGPDRDRLPRRTVRQNRKQEPNETSENLLDILEIVVHRLDGLPVFCVPLPSRHEKCRFVLKPLANTLSDFVSFLKLEDSAIGHVEAYTEGELTRTVVY